MCHGVPYGRGIYHGFTHGIPKERVDSTAPAMEIPHDTCHVASNDTHRGLSVRQPIGRPWPASCRGVFYWECIVVLRWDMP